jgi:hypothetical protein
LGILGYEVINDPHFIKTLHVHSTNIRNYTSASVIKEPWAVSSPANINPLQLHPSLGYDPKLISETTQNFQTMNLTDNHTIHDYILQKREKNQHFVIPRVSGIENNFAVFGRIMKQKGPNQTSPQIIQYIQNVSNAMKNNAGIKLSSYESVIKYSDAYLKAFDQCETFAGWDVQGNYIGHIAQSYDWMKKMYKNKPIFWALAFDIFHSIYSTPWTLSLEGMRILIISPFEESILEKIPIREKIYGIDLFPNCTFVTMKPPQTQASENSEEFDVEFDNFKKRLSTKLDEFDIALVSCGGYGNPICAYLYENNKSAIYVGGVLQMYFGILGSRWVKERFDVLKIFYNDTYWSRPKEKERPKGSNLVENGCYW